LTRQTSRKKRHKIKQINRNRINYLRKLKQCKKRGFDREIHAQTQPANASPTHKPLGCSCKLQGRPKRSPRIFATC
jgi:hypothetical protein